METYGSGDLVESILREMVDEGELEMGVREDGEIVFWVKDDWGSSPPLSEERVAHDPLG